MTAPSSGYAGDWSGTTTQGQAIQFTVSSRSEVIAIHISYSFNGCVGSHSFANLSVPIVTPQPPGPPPFDNPGFGYTTRSDDGVSGTLVAGHFSSDRVAAGVFNFLDYPNCGSAIGSWTANRR